MEAGDEIGLCGWEGGGLGCFGRGWAQVWRLSGNNDVWSCTRGYSDYCTVGALALWVAACGERVR